MTHGVASQINLTFERAALLAGSVSAALGSIGIAGWLLDMPKLQSFGYGFATMKMNTAVSLLLASVGLILTAKPSAARAPIDAARGCALLVLFFGAASLAEYATGLNLGIDQLLIDAPRTGDGEAPGRMAPNTALSISLIGAAQLVSDSSRRAALAAAQIASLLALFIAFLALSGYFLNVNALYGVAGYTSMALPTSIALAAVATGILASRPDRGLAAILAQANSAGASIRRFLPILVALPLLLAWIQHLGIRAGQFNADFGAALTATVSVCLLSALALRDARNQGSWQSERARLDEQVRLALESAPNGMLIVDGQGKVVLVNAEVERLFGYSRAELIGGPVEKLLPLELRSEHEVLRTHYQSKPVRRAMAPAARTLHGSHSDGGIVPVEVGLNPLRMRQEDFVLATIVDVRVRERTERAAERERFFQLSSDALCIANISGYFVQVNPGFEQILGYTRDELLAAPFLSLVHPEDAEASAAQAKKAAAGERIIDFRNRLRGKDGQYRWLQWRVMPDEAGLLYATARDITRELEATHALQASVTERGLLLQEVHHRVKNNLQIIASMINMQVRKLQTGVARDALEECGSRVQAIGLVHEVLFQSKDFSRIPFREYVSSLVNYVVHASTHNPAAITSEVDIAPVALTVEKGIPCGLIINELVTNALKHAFPDERRGNIRVSLREQADGQLALSVADDGVGLDETFDIRKSASVGLTLVATLVDQLKGRLFVTRAPGARFDIIFPQESRS